MKFFLPFLASLDWTIWGLEDQLFDNCLSENMAWKSTLNIMHRGIITVSHLIHKSDIPSGEGMASRIAYFWCAILTHGVTSQPFKLTDKVGPWPPMPRVSSLLLQSQFNQSLQLLSYNWFLRTLGYQQKSIFITVIRNNCENLCNITCHLETIRCNRIAISL